MKRPERPRLLNRTVVCGCGEDASAWTEYYYERDKVDSYVYAMDAYLRDEVLPVLRDWITAIIPCTCHQSYTQRRLIDPNCHYHEYESELQQTKALIAALEAHDE